MALIVEPAPANTRDHTLLPATLDRFTALKPTLGPLPKHPRLALNGGHDDRMVNDGLADRPGAAVELFLALVSTAITVR